ncbi:MAG: BlaI/MecI/CopY family transcriptional regulator [Verrucomicrobiales bacterium]|nr:BlaI/MecI/CopY family transcriptional regulator [Verrucomicrobiales bacterium]MCP5525478.1 BlaI/MecI/CopY family transcriptional regulator [Verrucomicrobiales bacterium]
MNTSPRISEAEWEVMRVVWASHPITAAGVIAALTRQDPKWHPKTIRTFLARLVQKGALDYEAEGRRYRYSPRVSAAECATEATNSFLDRVFEGSLAPMLAHFVRHRNLRPQEIETLKRILDGKEP